MRFVVVVLYAVASPMCALSVEMATAISTLKPFSASYTYAILIRNHEFSAENKPRFTDTFDPFGDWDHIAIRRVFLWMH